MQGFKGSWHQYDYEVEKDIAVSMDDGAVLYLDIYRPALNGAPISNPCPVLLERSLYTYLFTLAYDRVFPVVQTGRTSEA